MVKLKIQGCFTHGFYKAQAKGLEGTISFKHVWHD